MKFIVFLIFIGVTICHSQEVDNENSVTLAVIDEPPIYPGCRGEDNKALKKCMIERISEYVVNNFNVKVGDSLNLSTTRQKIFVQFKVSRNGDVEDITVVANHKKLESEAKRVIKSLPKFKPGKQDGKQVGVFYSLPIIFEIDNKK